jgi:hypothetical protein
LFLLFSLFPAFDRPYFLFPSILYLSFFIRWCSEDGKKFGKEIESVAPPIPTGWEVTKSWRTYGTDTDPEGWQYSQTFESPYWYADVEQGRGCKPLRTAFFLSFLIFLNCCVVVVRRRTWHREIRNIAGVGNSNSRKSSASADKGPGRRKRMFADKEKKK